MSNIINIPPLPEGWSGTPDELLQFINESGAIESDGTSESGGTIGGQVGGTTPGSDVGIWFNRHSIEIFVDGEYQPISDVPVGTGMPYFGSLSTPPENWLVMDGRSLLRADYPALFAAIGTLWNPDAEPTVFNLPNPSGRVMYGSGQGSYADNHDAELTGSTEEFTEGEYVGRNWIRKEPKYAGIPNAFAISSTGLVEAGQKYGATYPAGMVVNWIIRYR